MKHKRYALFVGRWQPFHLGHKYIIDQALKQGKDVAVAVRDTELSEKNPYTVEQRIQMIKQVYGDKVLVIPICDIESINIGRNVGYDVIHYEVPRQIEDISATKIRSAKTTSSMTDVPEEVKAYLAKISPTFWLFGLPCSGKTTLAKLMKERMADKNRRVIHFDGDTLRAGLNKDLGFSEKDREENLRRAAHMAKLFNEQGHSVVCSFITPTEANRKMIREIIPNVYFIYTKCSVATCKQRDVKGMYKKAMEGKIKGFTGVDDPFEEPKKPDLLVNTEKADIDTCLRQILDAYL